MRRTLRYLLLAALTLVCGSTFAEDKTVTWDASTNDALPNVSVGNDITLTWIEGSGDQAPSYSTQSNKKVVYMKKGNKLTVAGAADAVTISKIVFTYVGDNIGLTPNVGSSSYNYSDNTSTWTGEANSITFSAGGKRYVKSIEVTYTGSAGTIVKAPVLAITQDNIADTYDMDANGVFVVYYANNGNAAAENAKLTLYVDGAENNSKEIGTLNFGENTQNFWNAKYNLEGLEAGAHQVYIKMTADNSEAVQTETKTVTFTKKAPEAAFSIAADAVTVPYNATSYNVVATLTETNNVAATNVKVELRKGISDVLATQTVATLAAGGNTQVTLNVAKENFETGEKTYNLYVNDKFLSSVVVTFEEAPVVETVNVALTAIQGISQIDLAEGANNTISVWAENTGNVAAEAAISVKLNGTAVGEAQTVSIAAGKNANASFTLPTTGLTVGQKATVVATITVANNTAEATTLTKEYDVVNSSVATEPEFSVTAQNVTVAYDATSFNVVATVKNTSTVDATNVEVKLTKGIEPVCEAQTIATLAAGAETTLTFTVADVVAGTYYVNVANNKAIAEVVVTVEEAPVTEVKDLAITEVLGTIKLENETNNVRVTVQNNGTVDITDAPVVLKAGEKTLGEATVRAKAGETGFCTIAVASEGLEAGELDVTATVTVEGDATPADNTMNAKLTVEAAPAPEATFTVTAENVSVKFGAQSFSIVAKVKNTSEVAATNVAVKLLKGITEVETKTVATLAAGAEETVTFTVNEIGEAGKTATYYVQAGNAQAEVTVTFEEQEVAPVVNVVISAIQGSLSLDVESNSLTVFVENKGNVDVKDAKVTLTIGTKTYEGTVTATAGETGFCSFAIPATDLEAGAITVTATVTVEGNTAAAEDTVETKQFNVTTAIQTILAQFGENVQIFTLSGKKVNDVHRGQVYIINGKKMLVK